MNSTDHEQAKKYLDRPSDAIEIQSSKAIPAALLGTRLITEGNALFERSTSLHSRPLARNLLDHSIPATVYYAGPTGLPHLQTSQMAQSA